MRSHHTRCPGLALLMTNRTFPKSCDTMQTIVDANYAGINP